MKLKRALVLCLLAGLGAAQELRFAADRPVDLTHLRLEAHVDLKAKTLRGKVTLEIVALRQTGTIRLDAVGLEIHGVRVARGGPAQVANYTYDDSVLQIRLAAEVSRGEALKVEVDYTCHDPQLGLAFFGPTKAEPDVPYQVWSQGETEATRYWIPVFDNPNERMTSEMHISADAGLMVLSNGACMGATEKRGISIWHWKQKKDHVPYLLMLVVGKFAVVTESWRGKPVAYWVPPDRKGDVMRSFSNTKRMLDFFSDKTGVEYPWSKYTQVVVEQFRHGGMENTSATTLNERTLHDEKSHVDFSSDGLVAHELAHQWFGDLLTCRDWAHTWLNEGFATYFEALWSEHDLGEDEFRYNMRSKALGAIRAGKKLPIVFRGYKNAWEQFDSRAYPKGAWVLHMIRRRLGDETWWRAIGHYTAKHAHTTVETADLRKALEQTTGRSFERFFHDWTRRPGNPVLSVSHRWVGKDKLLEVRARQTQKEAAFHFPLRLEYWLGDGKKLALTHDVKTKDERFYVPLAAAPSLIRIDPSFSVLMELVEQKGRNYWVRQLFDDPDVIARIRAAEHFSKSRRDADRRLLAKALGREKFWGVQSEIAGALGKSGGTVSRDVLLQALSIEHPKARKAVVDALARFRNDDTVTLALEGIVSNGDASYRVEESAIRAWSSRRPKNALARLQPLLQRDSHNEIIRSAAIAGIGEQRDARATNLLLDWTRRGRPRPCRPSALEALGKLARSAAWDKATQARVAGVVAGYLHRDEPRRVKSAAINTLRDLGEASEPALEALEALFLHDQNDGVRDEAKKAVDKIRSGTPARLELSRLREELRKLREADKKLRERVEKMERKSPEPVDGE